MTDSDIGGCTVCTTQIKNNFDFGNTLYTEFFQ